MQTVTRWFPRLMTRKEKLREDFQDAMGICRECFEVTEVLRPCCGGDVEYNSIIFSRDDFEDEGEQDGKKESIDSSSRVWN